MRVLEAEQAAEAQLAQARAAADRTRRAARDEAAAITKRTGARIDGISQRFRAKIDRDKEALVAERTGGGRARKPQWDASEIHEAARRLAARLIGLT